MPKNMSRRKNKWKNKRRNINRGNFLYVHPPHHPWAPFTLPHTSTLRICRSRGRFNLHLPEFQLLCLWRCTGKPRYGHSIEGLSVVCVSLFSHFCFWDLKTRVPFSWAQATFSSHGTILRKGGRIERSRVNEASSQILSRSKLVASDRFLFNQ